MRRGFFQGGGADMMEKVEYTTAIMPCIDRHAQQRANDNGSRLEHLSVMLFSETPCRIEFIPGLQTRTSIRQSEDVVAWRMMSCGPGSRLVHVRTSLRGPQRSC